MGQEGFEPEPVVDIISSAPEEKQKTRAKKVFWAGV